MEHNEDETIIFIEDEDIVFTEEQKETECKLIYSTLKTNDFGVYRQGCCYVIVKDEKSCHQVVDIMKTIGWKYDGIEGDVIHWFTKDINKGN